MQVVSCTENMKACDNQRERLQGMLHTDNGNSFMETQKKSAIDKRFSACGDRIE